MSWTRTPQCGDIYRHYKYGDLYEVHRVYKRESDGVMEVGYESMEDSSLPPFVRPLHEWTALVEHDGRWVPRYEFISSAWAQKASA